MADIHATILERMLTIALEHASDDRTRTPLCQVKLERTPGGLRMVATDGYRLSVHDAPCPEPGLPEVCITTTQAAELLSGIKAWRKGLPRDIRETAKVALDGWAVTFGATSMTLTPASEQFPPYEQVLPEYDPERKGETVGISALYLAAAAKACGMVAPPKSGGMKITMGAPLTPVTFHAETPEGESITVIVMPMRI